jgi:hypothetical protein
VCGIARFDDLFQRYVTHIESKFGLPSPFVGTVASVTVCGQEWFDVAAIIDRWLRGNTPIDTGGNEKQSKESCKNLRVHDLRYSGTNSAGFGQHN